MENKTERNLEIVALKEKGFTFDKIAKEHGITRERVRQIYLREKRKKEIVNELPYLRINLQDRNDKKFYHSLLRYRNLYYGFQHVLSKEEFLNINPDDFMRFHQVGAMQVDRLVELQNELKKED